MLVVVLSRNKTDGVPHLYVMNRASRMIQCAQRGFIMLTYKIWSSPTMTHTGDKENIIVPPFMILTVPGVPVWH